MKKVIISILIIALLLVLVQVLDKSEAPYIPILWGIIIVAPLLYFVFAKAAKHNLIYILGYAVLVLVTVLSTRLVFTSFAMGSDKYLLTSFTWLIFAQLGVWAQYYFTRHKAPADALSLGIALPAEKSANIRALITDGRIEEAVEQLTAGEELNQEQKVIVTNFGFRFTKVKEQEAMGLMTTEEVTVAKNRIVTGILRYV